MTETKKILNIALPAMAENLLQMLMGVVDSYLVAQVGIVAISGVSVANNIITIYQAIFIALGASSASVIARSLGKGDIKAPAAGRRWTRGSIWNGCAGALRRRPRV